MSRFLSTGGCLAQGRGCLVSGGVWSVGGGPVPGRGSFLWFLLECILVVIWIKWHGHFERFHITGRVQGLFVPFACAGSGDPVRVLRLYTMNTLDTLWSIYCWDICTTCHYQNYVLLYWLIHSCLRWSLSVTTWLTDWLRLSLALYCAVPFIAACVDVSRTVFWDRSRLNISKTNTCSWYMFNQYTNSIQNLISVKELLGWCLFSISFKIRLNILGYKFFNRFDDFYMNVVFLDLSP